MSNITVFSGLSKVNRHKKGFAECEEIGKIIAAKGYTMICAGASLGCQNNLIQGALANDGKVIAVTVPMFKNELQDELKDEAIIASGADLSERKSIMKSMADYGYIILPGGPGTLDELWEIISEKAENINGGKEKKIIIVNTEGFYNPVREQLEMMNTIFEWTYNEGIIFINEAKDLDAHLPQSGKTDVVVKSSADEGKTAGPKGGEKHGRRHMRKTKKDKTSKRKTSKRKTSKRKTSKRKTK